MYRILSRNLLEDAFDDTVFQNAVYGTLVVAARLSVQTTA